MHGSFTVKFTQAGHTISGTISVASSCVGEGTVSGASAGPAVTFGALKAAETVAFDGTITGNTMHGGYHSGPTCGDDNGTWMAARG